MIKKWNKDKIIAIIRKEYKNGTNLMACSVGKNKPYLYHAARSYFGNWGNAIKAARLNYEEFVQRNREDKKNRLLNSIRMLLKMGRPLNSGYIKKYYPKFYSRSLTLFGGWMKAVTTAIPNYFEIYEKRERKKMIDQLKSLYRPQKRFTHKYLEAHSFPFHKAIKYFGSWQNAIRAAGFTPPPVNFRWSKEVVIDKLKELLNKGIRLNTANVKRRSLILYSAAERHFGSWRAALAALGLDYNKVAVSPRKKVK